MNDLDVRKIQEIKKKYDSFTSVFCREFYGKKIEYGIIKGNNKILFIKPGQDGILTGYNDKYYNLAKYVNEKYGYTVVCSNNPYEAPYNPLDDMSIVIEEYARNMKFKDYEVYYYGNSRGGMLGARYAHQYPYIKRLLLVNPPLFMNYHKMEKGILKFNGEKMFFIYGSLDPSYKFVGLLDIVKNTKIAYKILENEDHNLSKGIYSLEYLVDNYLLNDFSNYIY